MIVVEKVSMKIGNFCMHDFFLAAKPGTPDRG
jgi:hypothetical protein